MSYRTQPEQPEMRGLFYRLYREFFDRAERRRRWSITEDIPWDQVNPGMNPAIADVVESFCAVEMYLPDYVAKALPMIRANRGWAWFHANWGYEESKHSLALHDWLLRSGHRTEEQMADLEEAVFAVEWDLPEDSAQGMLIYAMVQELATWLNYRNLKVRVDEIGDPALSKILGFIAVDERAHHNFYRTVTSHFLEYDRETTLEQLRRVLLGFSMPALHMLAGSQQRTAQIKALDIFDEDKFLREVYQPVLETLGLKSRDLKRIAPCRKSI
ncbi:MAG: acyl-ACP desaturase [Gemmataceae bacterium]